MIYDIKGKNIANDYLKNKEKEVLEAEIQELLNYAKNLIGEEQYESAEENLLKVCEKSPKQEAVEEAEALLKTVAEGQLEKLVNNITEAIKAEKYKVASDNLEIAQKLLSRCGDNKKVKNIAKQLIKSEEKINEIIQKCLKNVDKAIKKKEYDKAAIYINQAKDMAGNCFSIDKVCSFEEQRIFIEKQIDDREFEVAVSSINALHQNFGLEKEFTKQISSLERKINRYQLSLVLVKGILLILFVVMIVLTNMRDMLPVKENVMYIVSALWIIIGVFVIKKSKRKRILFYKMLLLSFNYAVWLLTMYYLNTRLEVSNIIMFAIVLAVVCGGFLITTVNNEKMGKIFLGNIAIVAGIITAVMIV